MPGCGLLGIAYATGKGIAVDEVRGRSWMQAGCNGNDAQSCAGLALMHANGRGGVPRDSVRAIGFWKAACTNAQSVAESCAYLGAGYLTGSGVAHDDVRAAQYLSQGCEGGVAMGCTLLASMYEAGTTVTAKSVTRAAEFYKRGCDGKSATACAWITAHPQALPQPPKP